MTQIKEKLEDRLNQMDVSKSEFQKILRDATGPSTGRTMGGVKDALGKEGAAALAKNIDAWRTKWLKQKFGTAHYMRADQWLSVLKKS